MTEGLLRLRQNERSRSQTVHTRAKCTQVIIAEGVKIREAWSRTVIVRFGPFGAELLQTYLQPAPLILLAYIFPMSPMPMIPTTVSSISIGMEEDD